MNRGDQLVACLRENANAAEKTPSPTYADAYRTRALVCALTLDAWVTAGNPPPEAWVAAFTQLRSVTS